MSRSAGIFLPNSKLETTTRCLRGSALSTRLGAQARDGKGDVLSFSSNSETISVWISASSSCIVVRYNLAVDSSIQRSAITPSRIARTCATLTPSSSSLATTTSLSAHGVPRAISYRQTGGQQFCRQADDSWVERITAANAYGVVHVEDAQILTVLSDIAIHLVAVDEGNIGRIHLESPLTPVHFDNTLSESVQRKGRLERRVLCPRYLYAA